MARFPQEVADRLLADCRRHCCLCLRWAGHRMHIHHIVPESSGGSGSHDNGIPVCLDCHAEVESSSSMGRRFSSGELREHRDRWVSVVRDHPEVLIRAAQAASETGPLEALLAELEFNKIAVDDGTLDEDFPVLLIDQFHRAIAMNALAALPASTREAVHRTYGVILRINYRFEEMARMDRSGGSGSAWAGARQERSKLRDQVRVLIPTLVGSLEACLGRPEEAATDLL